MHAVTRETAPRDQEQDEDEDDEVPERGELFGTETMAELCVRQGRLPDALSIYRRLLADGTTDEERRERWRQRLQLLEHGPGTDSVPAAPGGRPTPPRPAPPASMAAASSRVAAAALAGVPARPSLHKLPVVVRDPVRAGQIVFAERNDLIVLGPVNPGAQLIADGNIHVYSRLRGRAVAGAHGATDARIYCQRLEAELVGIDAAYITAEDIPPDRHGLPAQIVWQAGRCLILPL